MSQLPRGTPTLLLLFALAGCDGAPAPAETAAAHPALTVATVSLQAESLPRDVVASGSIAAFEEMSLGIEVAGMRVERVHVDIGSSVRKDDVLVTLDTRQLRAQLRQVEAQLAQAIAQRELAAANAKRWSMMAAKKLVATSELEAASANAAVAAAGVQVAQAALDRARLDLEFATLRAPDDGVIGVRAVEPGQVVNPGAVLLTLVRQGRLEWQAQLPERDLLAVRPGLKVRLNDPLGAPVDGVVRVVAPGLDPRTRTGPVLVDLPQPGRLLPGMFAEGRFQLGDSAADVLPASAVLQRDGYAYVFVVGGDSRVQQRRVELGVSVGERIEVLGGLQPGEAVVVEGGGFLNDGDRVKVVAGAVIEGAAAESNPP